MGQRKKLIKKVFKCRHDLDPDFPIEHVKDGENSYIVGRCVRCGAIVALKERKHA